MEGKLVDVNQALVTMLGYASRKELMAEDLTGAIFLDPSIRHQILDGSSPENPVKPAEIDWKRGDGTTLKVRLSGREVQGERGNIEGYEVIVEDLTNQREIELFDLDQLKQILEKYASPRSAALQTLLRWQRTDKEAKPSSGQQRWGVMGC